MTKQTITRSMIRTTIRGCVLTYANGVPNVETLDPVVVYGKVSNKDAKKILAAYAGVENVMVGEVNSEHVVMEITLADFLEHAYEVKPGTKSDNPGIEEE